MVRLAPTVAVLLLCSFARAADPTLGEAQADYSAGNYQQSLQKIARILSNPRTTAKPGTPERYDLLMLRGENGLKMKQGRLAAEAFDAAWRTSKQDADLKDPAAAQANAVLVKAAPGLVYRPVGDNNGIDIVDPESRKRAMAALYQDRTKALEPQVAAALKDDSLVPSQKLLPALTDLYALELTSTGDVAKTTPILKSLGEHARKLIGVEVQRLSSRLTELDALAVEPTISRQVGGDDLSYRGLTSPERDEVKDAAAYLNKIAQTAQLGRRLARRLNGDVPAWDAILADTDTARDVAQRAYDRRGEKTAM